MSRRDVVGVDPGNGRGSAVIVHRSPAVPGELHLGPADECHVCNPTPPAPSSSDGPRLPDGAGVVIGLGLGALLWIPIVWALVWALEQL